MSKISDKIYAAGFFDGEGHLHISVGVTKYGYMASYMKVGISNTNLLVLEWLQVNWSGNIHKKKKKENRKQSYQWTAISHVAVDFLSDVFPYLKVKQEEAKICLEFQNHLSTKQRNIHVDIDELNRRLILRNQLDGVKNTNRLITSKRRLELVS